MKTGFATLVTLALAATVRAAVGDACSAAGTPGVCLATATCTAGSGTTHTGYCPNDPSDVKCCTKSCSTGGQCRLTSSCPSGNTLSGLCPGPSTVKCCLPASGCNTGPSVNTATLDLIKLSEGFVPNIYNDPVGLPTVGYRHLCQNTGCSEVPYSFPLTVATGTALLMSDLKTYQNCLAKAVAKTIRLNANQYGALVSWTFNVGCGAMQGSSLLSRLNAGETPNTVASEELPKWKYGGGVVLPGLVTRRAREVTLFKTATSTGALPNC